MLQRAWYAVVLLFVFLLLTAMGGSGGFERAPRVDKNYHVVITDGSGNAIKGEQFSWEGRVQFSGTLGMAQVSIPFDKVKDLSVGARKDRNMVVNARLVDGTDTSFEIDAKSRCYGVASFGSFMLQMDEIKSIAFQGQ